MAQGHNGALRPFVSEQGLETTTHPRKSSPGIQDSGLLKLMNCCWLALGDDDHFDSVQTLRRGNLPVSRLAKRGHRHRATP